MQWIDGTIAPRGRPGARGSPRAPDVRLRPPRCDLTDGNGRDPTVWNTGPPGSPGNSQCGKSHGWSPPSLKQGRSVPIPFGWWPPGARTGPILPAHARLLALPECIGPPGRPGISQCGKSHWWNPPSLKQGRSAPIPLGWWPPGVRAGPISHPRARFPGRRPPRLEAPSPPVPIGNGGVGRCANTSPPFGRSGGVFYPQPFRGTPSPPRIARERWHEER